MSYNCQIAFIIGLFNFQYPLHRLVRACLQLFVVVAGLTRTLLVSR